MTATRRSAVSTKRLTTRPDKGWIVVDMKNDWKEIFPPKE